MKTVANNSQHNRALLQSIARRAMVEGGLLPDFSPAALAELEKISATPEVVDASSFRDLRDLPWASIDNDDSRDLDQLTVAQRLPGGTVKILVAVADVDFLVKDRTAIDGHARHNTTSVYTAAEIFSMLPEKLSTDLSSLNLNEDHLAIVVEMVTGADGVLQTSDIYRARVRNHAKLAYNSVAAWLDGNGSAPEALATVDALDDNLRLQDGVAQSMKKLRHVHGALSLETIEARPIFEGDQIRGLELEKRTVPSKLSKIL